MDRRDFLSDVTRAAALCAVVPNVWRVTYRPRFADDPFTLGVASGDPTATGGVLWTRLAPRPFEPDGGMSDRTVVTWEVADDEGFTKIVKTGRATAAQELSYSVHVNLDGLTPDRWYFYRFQTGDAKSQVGRFRTAPADGAMTPLRMAVASCQRWDQGLFTAYEHMAREELDLVAHLGDYIYEYSSPANAIRKHQGLEIRTLDDYRRRYAQYKTDPALQAAHQRAPWVVTWDDHEVDNNYANLRGENEMESTDQMRVRRAAAYQAWWEHQPVRVPRVTSWADLSITRTINWGALARFWMLDTRQYRDIQPCDSGTKPVPCGEWADPKRQLMGAAQEQWLFSGLAASKSHWQVLGQQVMVGPYDSGPGPEVRVSMDQWSGYPAARDRLLNTIAQRAANRTVVLTGDIHSNWVNELRSDFSRPDRPVVAAEFVGTSIASGGDGNGEANERMRTQLAENPHIKWYQNRRGYYTCRVDAKEWLTDYKSVAYVTRPGAPLETASKWRVVHGKAGIERV
ncbi:MAG: alkaline phosphatase D family protein [Gemmatimonadaceae bacterium]|jgi:alkaline phosphatase D|nr:alkaline phosphatase D family protein [Gemmatimonadaceae bacterium]MCC6430469.1 alkaline phosphatase D family protein [Gemmatimonadaceae bacterium]